MKRVTWLYGARKMSGLTRPQAAEALHVDEFTLYRYEVGLRGVRTDDVEFAQRAARLYGLGEWACPHCGAMHPASDGRPAV